MITAYAHAALTAKDMAKSLKFYTEALGFKVAFDLKNPRTGDPWIEYLLVAPGQFLELFYGGQDAPQTPDAAGFNHLCFAVDDLEATVERVRSAGYPIDVEPQLGSDGNWQAWVRDPDGVRIELMKIMPASPQARFY